MFTRIKAHDWFTPRDHVKDGRVYTFSDFEYVITLGVGVIASAGVGMAFTVLL